MKEKLSDDTILRLGRALLEFAASDARQALDEIGGLLTQQALENNLADSERPREFYQGYIKGLGAALEECDAICTTAVALGRTKERS